GPARLTLRTPKSAISVARYKHSEESVPARVDSMSEDAFLAIFQLRSHAPHRIREDGQTRIAPCAAQGTLHVLDLNTPFSADHETNIDSLHVHLPRAALDDLAADIGAAPIIDLKAPMPWTTQDVVIPQFQASIIEALAGAEAPSLLYSDHLIQIMARHIAYTYGGMRPGVLVKGGLAPWQARRAREMIASSLARQVSLDDVANACGLSSSYFARAFKASTGTTPHEWLQTCRVDRARELLRHPSHSLVEIAADCGFSDQSHFTRIFKRVTGQTPGVWRGLREPLPMTASI
ncbi:MAG: helix-turn-helix transcriptional regulator, partial [Bosea sp. (in: a-proteobacteria)]